MASIIVLGAGMVGSVIATDLSDDAQLEVAVVDANEANLQSARDRSSGRVKTFQADLSDASAVARSVEPFDLVCIAVPGRMGFDTLRAAIDAGRNCCDISFFPEDARQLDALAKLRGVTAVVDCGVAPGMSHILAAHSAAQLDQCTSIEILVGGLPRCPQWPFNYKAAFSPADVIEEYVRPAWQKRGGCIIERPALSDVRSIEFANVGVLEAFYTDGLRSLLHTLDVPEMSEQTLRYPGHAELMRIFRETGLFNQEPIQVGSTTVQPRDVTAALLFPQWKYAPGEADLTVMRVVAQGKRRGRHAQIVWDLLDGYDPASDMSSMSRTTAFPCCIVARMILGGAIHQPGIVFPERIGQTPGVLEHLLAEHKRRGVIYRRSEPPT